MKRRQLSTVASLLALLLVGVWYIGSAILRVDPYSDPFTVTVNLSESGGLLDRSQVTYRGVPVGRVEQIRLLPNKVMVDVQIDEGTHIPVDSDVVIANLSAAGEQYLDFRPHADAGPYLANGSKIAEARTSTPVPFAQLLESVDNVVKQVDTTTLKRVVDELDLAFSGSAPDLRRILDGGAYMLSGLTEVLPETSRLLGNAPVVLGTVADLSDELTRFTAAGQSLGQTLTKADPTINQLLTDAPETLGILDKVVTENGPSLAALLGDLSTVSQVLVDRRPAISEYLPRLVDAGNAVSGWVRDGAVVVIADVFPREVCDYGSPRHQPSNVDVPPPLLYEYCSRTNPELQQRGSGNAPRPPGDNTNGPPPTATGAERARVD